MKRQLITGMLMLLASGLMAQAVNPEVLKQKKEAMARMKAIEGQWHGKGWHRMGPGEPKWFDQREDVVFKLNGLALLVEGTGTNPETGQVAFNALALMTFDPADGQYHFFSITMEGNSVNAQGHWEADQFIWGFTTPQGATIRYTMNLGTPGKWNEYGEYSADQKTWIRFMEMNLDRDNQSQTVK